MKVVDVWTGERASALQRAMRMTNEAFADRIGTYARTVAKWNAKPDVQLSAEMQEALDTMLYEAGEPVQKRFGLLVRVEDLARTTDDTSAKDIAAALDRLNADPNIRAALEWLDDGAGWEPGMARQRVAAQLAEMDENDLRDRAAARSRVGRVQVAEALASYYDPPAGYGLFAARFGDSEQLHTSVLTHADWLDLECELAPATDQATLASTKRAADPALDDLGTQGAVHRLAETVATGTRMVDAPLYRLLEVGAKKGRISGSFGMTTFVRYALTMDLLEGELVDALAAGRVVDRTALPLRTRFLPDAQAVLDVRNRMCAGGALALCAIARPATPRRPASDYLLLVQERGGSVLNAARRLAVIPKCFHEPLADYRDDTQIGSTLRREMEEELFGRDDVDSALTTQKHADPMHPSKLSEPMKWLTAHSSPYRWQMECTGFGLNLVSGNYEFASLIVIHDETFWNEFGGDVAANWESDTLRQYSSRDRHALEELTTDDAWSNEGLFALLQGLRRLAQLGSDRVDLPPIDWELQ